MTDRLCICVRYSRPGGGGSHPVEGTWLTNRGDLEITIEGAFEGLSVSGSRGAGGNIQGLVLTDVEVGCGLGSRATRRGYAFASAVCQPRQALPQLLMPKLTRAIVWSWLAVSVRSYFRRILH